MAKTYRRKVFDKETGEWKEGKTWWITFTQNGRQEKRSLGVTDRKSAEMLKADIERNIERGKVGLPQSYVDMYELYEEYKNAVIKKKSPAYQKRMFQNLKPFLIFVQETKQMNLAKVTVRDIEEHMGARQQQLSPKSWNDEVREISRLFRFAIDREYLFQNPVAKVPLQKTIRHSIEIFTPEELELIFKYAHQPSVPYYKILLYTGMRDGEARHLRWHEVDLTPGREHIKIRNTSLHLTKTRRDRSVPLCEEAIVILKELYAQRDPDNPFVFPGRGGGHRGQNRNTWVNCFRRIYQETGIKIEKGFHTSGVHLFRHTFATNALASGIDIRTVQDMLGHSTIMMTQRYTNLLPGMKQEQIKKLDIQIGRRKDPDPNNNDGQD